MKFVSILVLFGLLFSSNITALSISTVLVGNPNNPSDSTGYGSVSYEYYIGKYEVTNSQYSVFLNDVAATDTHGLYEQATVVTTITMSKKVIVINL